MLHAGETRKVTMIPIRKISQSHNTWWLLSRVVQPRGKVLVEEANPSFRRKDVCSIVMAEHITIVAPLRWKDLLIIAWDKKLTCGESLHPHSIEIAAEMFAKLASYSKLKSHAILCISSV